MLGQSFTLAGLAAVSGIAAADARADGSRGLVRREILALEADPRSPERGQYAFVQALIREVAYNTLSRSDRKTRHLAAARFFASARTSSPAPSRATISPQTRTRPGGPERDRARAARARVRARGEVVAREGAGELVGAERLEAARRRGGARRSLARACCRRPRGSGPGRTRTGPAPGTADRRRRARSSRRTSDRSRGSSVAPRDARRPPQGRRA